MNDAELLAGLQAQCREGIRAKYVFFWRHEPGARASNLAHTLSNWYGSPFELEGARYPTVEHWMMAEKARLFGDEEARELVLAAPHPGAAKALGRQVRGFEEELWIRERYPLVRRGVQAKFEQNAELGTFLQGTQQRVLAEASPTDRIWGIGLAADDPNAQNPLHWSGLNLLGFALMDVRETLRLRTGGD